MAAFPIQSLAISELFGFRPIYEVASDPDLQAVLLFEESDILSRELVRVLPERMTANK